MRSALPNVADVVAAEPVSGPVGAGLFLLSRSLFGRRGSGVKRRRVRACLAALDAAFRAG